MDFRYPLAFTGRRSAVMAQNGMVATSHPVAADAGVHILRSGGNAVDAALTSTAVLSVAEPRMAGIGGDAFALVHQDGTIMGINGSGSAPEQASIETYRNRTSATNEDGEPAMPTDGGLPVTVPGALDALVRLLDEFGTMSLSDILQPAIEYASDGIPMTEVIARQFAVERDRVDSFEPLSDVVYPDGTPPRPGQHVSYPALAKTLGRIADEGPAVFYGGPIGEAIVEAVRTNGGDLSLPDLKKHEAEWVEPISTTHRDYEMLELPPNTQGPIALEAINIANIFDLRSERTAAERLHYLIEATKIAFADGDATIGDPDGSDGSFDAILSPSYAATRAKDIGPDASDYPAGTGPTGSDTVLVTAVDSDGTAVSILTSLYSPFGSGLVA